MASILCSKLKRNDVASLKDIILDKAQDILEELEGSNAHINRMYHKPQQDITVALMTSGTSNQESTHTSSAWAPDYFAEDPDTGRDHHSEDSHTSTSVRNMNFANRRPKDPPSDWNRDYVADEQGPDYFADKQAPVEKHTYQNSHISVDRITLYTSMGLSHEDATAEALLDARLEKPHSVQGQTSQSPTININSVGVRRTACTDPTGEDVTPDPRMTKGRLQQPQQGRATHRHTPQGLN